MNTPLKALTLNTWMLRAPFGIDSAEDIDERVRLLPSKVAETGADLIFFKENSPDGVIDYVFVSPQPQLVPMASEGVFSKPITTTEYQRYQLRRSPQRLSDHYGICTTCSIRPAALG